MTLEARIADEAARAQLACAPAAGLLHGIVTFVEHDDRWVRPLRFSDDQLRALGSCQAWHPGLYRQLARTTAGVCVEFETDSGEVALEVSLDAESKAVRSLLAAIDQEGEPQVYDTFSVDIDGRHLACGMPAEGEGLVRLRLTGSDPEDAMGLLPLPGMGRTRNVRLWLPALRGCLVRDLYGDGSYLRPVARRHNLLVVGDASAQGLVSEDPALSWPALLADKLGLDLVNQGLAGQVFQPGSLYGLAGAIDPDRIIVAFGSAYRHEACVARRVSRDVRSYLLELARLWPEVPTCVLTPLWQDEETRASHRMSCWDQVPSFLAAHTAPHDQMTLIDGLELVDHDQDFFVGETAYPNQRGCRQIANRINGVIRIPGLRPSSVGKRRKKRARPQSQPEAPDSNVLQLPFGESV